MRDEQTSGPKVPSDVRKKLEKLCGRLHEVLGDSLVSVVLYGPLAKGGVGNNTPANIMLVLREVTTRLVQQVDR